VEEAADLANARAAALVKELADSGRAQPGLDRLREAVTGLAKEIEQAEAAGVSIGNAQRSSLERLRGLVEQLDEKVAPTADKVTTALNAAEEEAAKLIATLEESGNAEQGLIRLRAATNRLKIEIEAAEESGRTIGDVPRASVERLNATYDEGVEKLGEYKKAQQDVKKDVDAATQAAGGQVREIRSLNDLVGRIDPRLAQFAVRWGVVASAITIAGTAIKKTFDAIEEGMQGIAGEDRNIFNPLNLDDYAAAVANIDRAWSALLRGDLQTASDAIGGVNSEVEQSTNLMALWRSQGLDPTGRSLDELRALLPALTKEFLAHREALAQLLHPNQLVQESYDETAARVVRAAETIRRHGRLDVGTESYETVRRQVAALVAEIEAAGAKVPAPLARLAAELDTAGLAFEQWARRSALSVDQVVEDAAALDDRILRFVRSASGKLDEADFAAIFGKDVQGILDAAARLGVEVPPRIQALADAWGIVTSAAEAAARAQEQIATRLRQQITGEVAKTREQLAAELAALPKALEGVDLKFLQFTDPAQYEEAKRLVRDYVEAYRAALQPIPEIVQDAANALGILITQSDLTAEQAARMNAVLDGTAESSVRVERNAEGVVTGLTNIADGYAKSREEAEQFLGAQRSAGDESARAGERYKQAADDAEEGAVALGEQAVAAGEAAAGLGEAAGATDEYGSAQDRAKEKLRQTGDEATRVSETFALIPSHATAAGESIDVAMASSHERVAQVSGAVGNLIASLQHALELERQLTSGDGGAPN
jgi:hypothetical protein